MDVAVRPRSDVVPESCCTLFENVVNPTTSNEPLNPVVPVTVKSVSQVRFPVTCASPSTVNPEHATADMVPVPLTVKSPSMVASSDVILLTTSVPPDASMKSVVIFGVVMVVVAFKVGVSMALHIAVPLTSKSVAISPYVARRTPVSTLYVLTESLVSIPVNTVFPIVDPPMFWIAGEIGSPSTVRFLQLIFVAAQSTASMFLRTAFTVVGTNNGLWPHRLIVVKIIYIGDFILADLIPLLQVSREDHVGIVLA